MRKVIHTLWLQGNDAAPPLVQFCISQWTRMNPDYDVVVFDEASAARELAGFPLQVHELSPQALSDVLRCSLLQGDGGIWVDAATLPVVPIDTWLHGVMTDSAFFAFEAPAPDRPIASWFLAAGANNQLMELWWAAVQAYWHKPRELATVPGQRFIIPSDPVTAMTSPQADGPTYPYFWFHYLFRMLIETNDEARELWRAVPKVSAEPPHRLQVLCLRHPNLPDPAIQAALAGTTIQKLDWRHQYPLERLAKFIP